MIKQLVYLLAIFFTLFSSVKPFKSFPKITSCQHSIPLVNYPLGGCSVLLAMKRAESNLKEREDAKFSARIEASKIVIPTQVSLTEISRSSGGSFEDDSLTTGLLWRGAMVLICFFWGTNYATIKDIYDSLPKDTLDPSLMLSIRFGLAALGMSFGLADASKLNKDLIQRSLFAGVIIFTGYLGQANGIIASTASKAAFFSSLNVVYSEVQNPQTYPGFGSPDSYTQLGFAKNNQGVFFV
mmetsp:Transcript_18775/g.31436  ORF Transcript_18775/g.31436 Transcript_18775/m.31436 type:complete len:240 (-) Transcript_18775:2935-3654(-)